MKQESPQFERCSEVLRCSPLFHILAEDVRKEMLSICKFETWKKGTHFSAQHLAEMFTVIVSGRLELTRVNQETGRQVTLFSLGAGDAFDVIALLDGKEHDINPVAAEALETIAAPMAKVRNWIEEHPEFNEAFLPYLGDKMRKLEDLSSDLALHETIKRLAHLILQQATPRAPVAEGCERRPMLINKMSNEAMARMIGSVRVVVNRHIQDFVQMGILTTRRGHVEIQDIEKLREFCGEAAVR